MSDENKINEDDKNSRKNGEFPVPPKTWIVWIAIIGGIIGLVLFKDRMTVPPEPIRPQEFMAKLDAGQIESATVNYSPQSPLQDIIGKYKPVDKNGEVVKNGPLISFHVKMPLTDKLIEKQIGR